MEFSINLFDILFQVIPSDILYLYVLQSYMVNEYTVQATYVIIAPDQRYIMDTMVDDLHSFQIEWQKRFQEFYGHSFRWVIKVQIGYSININIMSCARESARLCDGPGIRRCIYIKHHCRPRRYMLEYFTATLDVYRSQTTGQTIDVFFKTRLTSVTRVRVTSSLKLLIVSRPSNIFYRSFQLITDKSIEINFDIRDLSGLNSDNCIHGGQLKLIKYINLSCCFFYRYRKSKDLTTRITTTPCNCCKLVVSKCCDINMLFCLKFYEKNHDY